MTGRSISRLSRQEGGSKLVFPTFDVHPGCIRRRVGKPTPTGFGYVVYMDMKFSRSDFDCFALEVRVIAFLYWVSRFLIPTQRTSCDLYAALDRIAE
jgi:hypothetical protein